MEAVPRRKNAGQSLVTNRNCIQSCTNQLAAFEQHPENLTFKIEAYFQFFLLHCEAPLRGHIVTYYQSKTNYESRHNAFLVVGNKYCLASR
jgi:hypothetical protein